MVAPGRIPFRSTLLVVTLAVVPAAVSLFVFFILRANAYHSYHELSFGRSVEQVSADFTQMVSVSGSLGLALILVNYVLNFGIVAVVAVIAARHLHWKRVACFYVVSIALLIGIGFGLPHQQARPAQYVAITAPQPYGAVALPDYWGHYWMKYPPYALVLAIMSGSLIAMTRLFKPGRRSWLARGMCPNCHYDLKGQIKCGCPECGWNRTGKVAQLETELLEKLIVKRSQIGWVVVCWTVIVLAILGAMWWKIEAIIPSHTDCSFQVALRNPQSYTYTDVVIDINVHAHTGWFGLQGKVTRLEWNAAFRKRTSPEIHGLPQFDTEVMLAKQGEYDTLAEIIAEQIDGTAVLRHGERDVRLDTALDQAQLAEWLDSVFSYAIPELPPEEAGAIIYVVNAWMDPEAAFLNPLQRLRLPPEYRVFSGIGSRGTPVSFSRPAASGIIIVIATLTIVWLYGVSLILRWGRCRIARIEESQS